MVPLFEDGTKLKIPFEITPSLICKMSRLRTFSLDIYVIKSDVCLFVCGHSDVRLTSPPVLKLWGTQGYLWLPYDLTEVINLGETFEPKKYFFSKEYFMSFLLYYCHSFQITVIPSVLLSFLPY